MPDYSDAKNVDANFSSSPFGVLKRVRIVDGIPMLYENDHHEVESDSIYTPEPEISREPEISVDEIVLNAVLKEREEGNKRIEEALFNQKVEFLNAMKRERREWVDAQASQMLLDINTNIDSAIKKIEDKIADILIPFVNHQFRLQSVNEVSSAINDAIRTDGNVCVAILGPEDLVESVSQKMDPNLKLKIKNNYEDEMSVIIDETLIDTKLLEWKSRLKSYVAN